VFDVCKEYREFQLRRKDILHITLHIKIQHRVVCITAVALCCQTW